MNLGNTLKDGNQAFQQDHAKAMIFIRHHLHEELKTKYLTVKRPYPLMEKFKGEIWESEDRNPPKNSLWLVPPEAARFKNVDEYNSALFKISLQLKLCEEKDN